MYQKSPPLSGKKHLPTMYDLPSENPEEPGLPDEFHDLQPEILRLTFRPPNYPLNQIFVASDMNLYYDVRHPQWYKRPDWFGVVGVPRLYQQQDLRLSYVMWQEEVTPIVIVELLSPGTEDEDLGETRQLAHQPPIKWQVYEEILQVPYYILFDRYTDQLQGFRLIGRRYQPMTLAPLGLWLEDLQLGLGLWLGTYQEITRLWLRWYDVAGNWIPTPEEFERQQAQQERQRAEQERQRAEQEQFKAQQERQRAEQEQFKAEQERQRAEQEQFKAQQERQRAEQEQFKAEQERQRAEQERIRAQELEAILLRYKERFGELPE